MMPFHSKAEAANLRPTQFLRTTTVAGVLPLIPLEHPAVLLTLPANLIEEQLRVDLTSIRLVHQKAPNETGKRATSGWLTVRPGLHL
jgi:hypothetical protein